MAKSDVYLELLKLIEDRSGIAALVELLAEPRPQIRMGPMGFNAKTIRDQYFKKVNTHHLTPKDKPFEVSGNIKCYNKCQPKQDLLMFLSVFLNYGNNINKALRELKISRVFRIKCRLYGIETQAKPQKLRDDQLTLSRIALAFPAHTAATILKNQKQGVLEYSSFFNQELPLLMQHTIFPGLVPAGKFTDELRGITSILNMEISVIFASKARHTHTQSYFTMYDDMDWITETVEEMVESSGKYVNAAIKNGIEDDMKCKVLTKAGILEVNADGELELSAATLVLVNKLEGLKAVYPLRYHEAIAKLKP